ncbi:MAG: twin-arginine translocase subunit TatC [Candidatus Methanoperedens sp.]|nr:twin-arginine translocase subunit TatC [Candidatus Methanoperedens sp.]MCZ7405992.1 twin-arginine translocase subunit TatC [Candidatus Methanoperedens sp.]
MAIEDVFSLISVIKKKVFYIVAVFGAGALVSFSFMGQVIKKIETDMFWRLELPDKTGASGQLVEISQNLTALSNRINDSVIAQNLTKISGDLINISSSLNIYKPNIVYLTPMEVLMLEFKMSLIFGVLLASPLVIYYAYKGLKGRLPAVISQNKSLIFSIIVAAVLLFLTGAGYAYFFMLPLFLSYLYQDAMSLGINANFSIYEFIYFIVMTTVIIGAAFELPLILNLLVRFGVTTRKTLSHYRKHAYILLLVIAAWITPGPDIFSQLMVTVPFVILYEASLLLMRLTGK